MQDIRLAAAIARGATVVTPNNRLAREVVLRHDDAQRRAGLRAWPPARALPWGAFVADLFQRAQDARVPIGAQILDESQSAHLWRAIVARDLDRTPLIDADACADLASEAWERMQSYGAGGESWRGFVDLGADPAMFARWAESFVRETRAKGAIDLARAADMLVPHAERLVGHGLADVVGTGFLELSPQQQRLFDALRRAGATIDVFAEASPPLAEGAVRTSLATPRDELMAAFAWARERALAVPGTTVGVVVLDLANRREEVRDLADDAFCPSLSWPGLHDAARPYELSAAPPLTDVPLVAAALGLLSLAQQPVPALEVAALVRSPYLPGSDAFAFDRARLEQRWIEQGHRELTLQRLAESLPLLDPLAARAASMLQRKPPGGRSSPREWAERWRSRLRTLGWCEGRPLGSAEHQARGAFERLLTDFARVGAVANRLAADEALATLRRMARGRAFQPEGMRPRVRILGLLEGVGLRFDALWVAGLTADAWPRSCEPNPLLPLVWQRERRVTRSRPARELEYAQAATAWLSHAAPEVVFSHARTVDDHPAAPSPLLLPLAERRIERPAVATTTERIYEMRPALARLDDASAPPIAAGTHLRGGAGLFDAQSACPFRATARYRLDAKEWPSEAPGVTPLEHGVLLHRTLDAFWSSMRDHASLVGSLASGTLDAALHDAVDRALADPSLRRRRTLPPVVVEAERDRLLALLRQWMVEVEAKRPPFTVLSTEGKARVAVRGVNVDVKLDRLDRLEGGGTAIIDYKSGEVDRPRQWFDARMRAPQLALYARTQAAPPTALAFAQLRSDKLEAVGIAEEPAPWPELTSPAALRIEGVADWTQALARLDEGIDRLAQGIAAGDARVDPRSKNDCNACSLHALCRIACINEAPAGDGIEPGGDGA